MRAELAAILAATSRAAPGLSGGRVQPFSKLGRVLALALCCVLLLFLSAEAAHAHPLGSPDLAHCSLCLAAHVAPHAASALPSGVVLVVWGAVVARRVLCGYTAVEAVCRIRPPPPLPLRAQMT